MEERDAYEDLGFARVDTGRHARCGFPEVVFCRGKLPEEAARIMQVVARRSGAAMATHASEDHHQAIANALPNSVYHPRARITTSVQSPLPPLPGRIGVVCAGTSDLPVADEAAVTLEFLGATIERIDDVGVAGIHRLLAARERLAALTTVVVVAGMEGALPSAVAGLVDCPVIAVPTSIGYGASFQGVAALLGMLNSCGSGVTVVNIDNGFGAGYAAATIHRMPEKIQSRP